MNIIQLIIECLKYWDLIFMMFFMYFLMYQWFIVEKSGGNPIYLFILSLIVGIWWMFKLDIIR